MDLMTDTDLELNADDLFASYDMDYSTKSVDKVPFIGLRNLGNTCFFNSVIQMLYYCPGFRKCLFIAEKKIRAFSTGEEIEKLFCDKKLIGMQTASEVQDKFTLLSELCDLFDMMQQNQDCLLRSDCTDVDRENLYAISPENLMNILRTVYPAFAPYTQQDAQECLRSILGILQDVISLVRGKNDAGNNEKATSETGRKLFGGRKLDATSQASTSSDRAQIENCDPNRQNIKQESRSTALRKRKFRSLLKNPMKLKSTPVHSSIQPLVELENGKLFGKNEKDADEHSEENNSVLEHTSSSSTSAKGCFAKFNKKKQECKISAKSTAVPTTPTKRLNVNEIPSTSPPFKRRKLNLSNGLKNFYKPLTSTFTKPKSYDVSGKKKSYNLPNSEKRSRTNPFKVVLKTGSTSSTYKLLDMDNKSTEGIVDTKIEKKEDKLTGNSITGSPVAEVKETLENVQAEKSHKFSAVENENISADFIEDLFQGQLVNEIRCMECENSLQRKENFMDISLPVKEDAFKTPSTETNNINEETVKKDTKNCSVVWGLSEFTSPEILEGENKYFCERCNRYVEGERRISFSNIPPVLTLHLKRFTASKPMAGGDAFCSTVSKINSSLNVPLELCLKDWCAKSCSERTFNYNLFGIVIHSGVTISSGHYLCYIHLNKSTGLSKDVNKEAVDQRLSSYEGSWLEVDDESTRILPHEEFLKLVSPQATEAVSRTPYLLLYHRSEKSKP